MNEEFYVKVVNYASNTYENANCSYDGKSYMVHVDMVVNVVTKFKPIFVYDEDFDNTVAAAYCHDLIEDAKQTYNDIKNIAGKDAADIVLGVTDVPAESRLMRHLLTMPKTVKDYRAILLKMCDMYANASYSKSNGSSMYNKYVEEYRYRRPIFKAALKWYKEDFILDVLDLLWNELDEIHNFNE